MAFGRAVRALDGGGILSSARRVWDKAIKYRYTEENPFDGLKALPPEGGVNRRGQAADDEEPMRTWSWSELVAIAGLLKSCYLLPFWIAVLAGLRISEVMGLTVKDWDSETRTLRIRSQRCASPAKGAKPPKTYASKRKIPVCQLLAIAIDRYIAENHGDPPGDREDRTRRENSYLIVGSRPLKRYDGSVGPMDPRTFANNLKATYKVLGLTPKNLGFTFAPVHILRHRFCTNLTSPESGLSARAVSVIMGHSQPSGDASKTTRAYQQLEPGDFEKVQRRMDELADEHLSAAYGITDLLEAVRVDDTMSVVDAARMLECDEDDVLDYVCTGHLTAVSTRTLSGVGSSPKTLLVDAETVTQLRRDLTKAALDTYNGTEVREMLRIGCDTLDKLVATNRLTEVTVNPRARVARRGAGKAGGGVPGGGRRFPKSEVDALKVAWAVRIERVDSWLTMKQAAVSAKCSPDTIRRAADDGEFEVWRDPESHRDERYVNPDSFDLFLASRATLTIAEAARRMALEEAEVRSMLKRGEIATSKPLGRPKPGAPRLQISEATVADVLRRKSDDAMIVYLEDGSQALGRVRLENGKVTLLIEARCA